MVAVTGSYGPQGGNGGRRPEDPLTVRLDALAELLGLSRTRVSAEALDESGQVLERVGERRRLALDHTVVALAGATGSGKSSLFNALTRPGLSEVGVRRPTTCAPVACAWDPGGAAGLLDRLGIAPQHRHSRRGALDGAARAGAVEHGLDGLVLLDLPDHDSASPGHREQVDRLLRLVDVVVWVVDPEKYADAALHERYLRPLAAHADVMLVVLNQVDRLPGETADLVLDDLRRLLDEDGLAVGEHGEAGAVVLALSALTGQGVPDLRAVLAQVVAGGGSARRRLAADVDRAAGALRPLYVGGDGGVGLEDATREEFVDRLADAAGAAAVGLAAERDWARTASDTVAAPWGRWLQDRQGEQDDAVRARAGSGHLPVSRPVVREAVRIVAEDASRGLPAPWAQAVRGAAERGGATLPEALDEATARVGPWTPHRPRWWTAIRLVQWLLTLVALSGLVGLAAIEAGTLHVSRGLPLALLVGATAAGPALAWVCRVAARGPARRYGQAVERRLRDAAADCGRVRVLEPVAAELLRYREVREQFAVVSGG